MPSLLDPSTMFNEPMFYLILATFLLAGTVKGLIGIGLPTIILGLLSQFLDPRFSVAMLLVPALVSNSWQVYRSKVAPELLVKLWPFAVTMGVGIWVFSRFAAELPTDILLASLGAVIILFVITTWFSKFPPIPQRLDRLFQIIFGSIAGVMGGLTAIWAPPMVIYLLSAKFSKDDLVGGMGLLLVAGLVPLTIGYVQSGLFNQSTLLLSTIMTVPIILGFTIGESFRKRMNTEQFRNALLLFFLLMGANLLRRGLFG